MAAPNYVPSWMHDVKDETIKSNEWNELTRHIYEAVDQHLSQSHVNYFTDLSEHEKSLLLERAARSVASSDGGRAYENMQSKLSYLLDQSVNNQVSKRMLEESPGDSKTDLVLDTTSEGIVSLLRKHPEQKYKLRVFINQALPQPIRYTAWQLFFANQSYRKMFVDKLTADPRLCLSPQDADIQRKTEQILASSPVFKEMKESKGYTNAMKGILSYYHTTLKSKRALHESEYYYAIPIVNSCFPALSKFESPTERTIAILIEMYLQFAQTMPTGIFQSINGNPDNVEMELMVKSVMNILQQYDQPLLEYFRDLSRKTSTPGIEEITFQTAFKSVVAPIIRNMFSGYLNINPLMFVWDQYVISADVGGYHEELLPIFAAIILMVLRDQLLVTRSIGDFDDCIKQQSAFIQTRQLQTVFSKYFLKTMQPKLTASPKFGPVIDPTVGRMQPWEHWHQDIIPYNRRNPKDKAAEDERLKAEINRRLEVEREAQDQIQKLRRELDYFKSQPKQVIVPRNLPASQQPVLDILKKIRSSVDIIAQGDGSQKHALDVQTTEDLRLHKLDLKIAEKEVFGRNLNPNEWDLLSENEKKVRSEKMLYIVKQRLQKRYTETGRF